MKGDEPGIIGVMERAEHEREPIQAGEGYYCEDCNIIMSDDAYGVHNADHTCRRIIWEFPKQVPGLVRKVGEK